jgi:hypothetical protein
LRYGRRIYSLLYMVYLHTAWFIVRTIKWRYPELTLVIINNNHFK